MKEERPTSYEELLRSAPVCAELASTGRHAPLVLDMKDIQHILGISRTTAYKLIHEDGFPMFHSGLLRAGGTRLATTEAERRPVSRSASRRFLSGWRGENKERKRKTAISARYGGKPPQK